jgi:hypothetical protein
MYSIPIFGRFLRDARVQAAWHALLRQKTVTKPPGLTPPEEDGAMWIQENETSKKGAKGFFFLSIPKP